MFRVCIDPPDQFPRSHGRTYVWDGENRPFSITNTANGTTSYFEHWPDGTRLSKYSVTAPGGATHWVAYFGSEVELAPDPLTGAYTFTKSPVAEAKITGTGGAAKRFYHHRDHLKSIRLITDGSGGTVKRATYRSFGDKGVESAAAGHREEKGNLKRE